jgi:hypothetical protein
MYTATELRSCQSGNHCTCPALSQEFAVVLHSAHVLCCANQTVVQPLLQAFLLLNSAAAFYRQPRAASASGRDLNVHHA